MKDWTGNKNSIFKTLGASNHCEHDREKHDYYATEPISAELLLKVESDLDNIWECVCGEGHLAEVFRNNMKLSRISDLIDREYKPYGIKYDYGVDFLTLKQEEYSWNGDIVTNPPYKHAKEFVEKAIELVENNRKVCMFLKLTFLEGKARKELFKKYPPKIIYVSSSRLKCALNGDFEKIGSSATAYAWFIWEKGYRGDTIIKWIN